MKYILICCSVLSLYACNGGQDQTATTGSDTAKSSNNIVSVDIVDTEKGYLELPGYRIRVVARYYREGASDEKDGNYLLIYNKSTGHADSLQLEATDDLDGVKIEDMTDSLHFDRLSLLLTWTGDSDVNYNEFVQYDKDKLKTVFSTDQLVSLRRRDQWTLEGFSRGRDEIVAHFQDDYPVIIALKTGDVQAPLPPVQYIGASTTALESIKVYKMNGRNDSSVYTIKKGTQLRVDTLYRASNIVRLLTSDSLILHAKPEDLDGKIEENTAG